MVYWVWWKLHESTNSRSAREFKSFHDQRTSDLKYAFVKTSYLENLKEKEMCQEASKICGQKGGLK